MNGRSLLVFVVLLVSIYILARQENKLEKNENLTEKVTLIYCGEHYKADRSLLGFYYIEGRENFTNIMLSMPYLDEYEEFHDIKNKLFKIESIPSYKENFGTIYENCKNYRHGLVSAHAVYIIKAREFIIEGVEFSDFCDFLFLSYRDAEDKYVIIDGDIVLFRYVKGDLKKIILTVRLSVPAVLSIDVDIDVGKRIKSASDLMVVNNNIRKIMDKVIVKKVALDGPNVSLRGMN
jgi:hypothetical protein